jgi:hypothetical protein
MSTGGLYAVTFLLPVRLHYLDRLTNPPDRPGLLLVHDDRDRPLRTSSQACEVGVERIYVSAPSSSSALSTSWAARGAVNLGGRARIGEQLLSR